MRPSGFGQLHLDPAAVRANQKPSFTAAVESELHVHHLMKAAFSAPFVRLVRQLTFCHVGCLAVRNHFCGTWSVDSFLPE